MLQACFIRSFVLFASLLCALAQKSPSSDDLPHSTVTPNIDQIIKGEYTVSVALPSPTTVEIDVQWQMDKFKKVLVTGPTTLISLIRWRDKDELTSLSPRNSSSGTLSTSSPQSSSPSGAQTSSPGVKPPMPMRSSQTPAQTSPYYSSSPSAGSAASGTPSIPSKTVPMSSGSSISKINLPSVLSVKCPLPACYQAALMEYQNQNKTYTTSTVPPVATARLKEQCVLWDSGCQTNLTKAQVAENWFGPNGTMYALQTDPCFDDLGFNQTECRGSAIVPESSALSVAAKSYMRGSQCVSDQNWYYASLKTEFLTSKTTTLTETFDTQEVSWRSGEVSTYPPGTFTLTHPPIPIETTDCGCGTCQLYGPNVDVFYWPEPGSDDSCLSIIGDKVNPLLEGAMTDEGGDVFWGTVTNSMDIYVGTKTTARIVTVNGITVKQALVNPWADDGEGTDMPSLTTTRPITSSQILDTSTITSPPVSVRARPKLIKRGPTGLNNSNSQEGGVHDSVVVLDGHTFISPSVYVAFTNLEAKDFCGHRGVGTISSTMLAFAPGELSTVEGHVLGPGYNLPETATKVFNFADLPCPPRSVMEAQWYKPAAGEPYRPLIALPQKVRELDPAWHDCHDPYYFTGLDPPRALAGATKVADPNQVMPDLPFKPGDCKDCHGKATALAPPQAPQGAAASPAPIPDSPIAAPTPQAASPKAPEDPQEAPADPKAADPKVADPQPGLEFGSGAGKADPDNLSDDQMSQLNQALSPQSNNPAPQPKPQAQPQDKGQGQPQQPKQPKYDQQPAPQNPPSGQGQQPPQDVPASNGQIVAPASFPSPQSPKQGSPAGSPQSGGGSSKPKEDPSGQSNFSPRPQNVVVGGDTYEVPQIAAKPAPVVNGQPIEKLPDGKQQVDGQILSPGGPPAVIGGSTVQVNPQGNPIINGQTFEPQPTAATNIASGHTIVNNGDRGVQVDGISLPTGNVQPASVGNQPAYVVANNPAQGSGKQPGLQLPANAPSAVTTLPGGQVVQAGNGGYRIQGQALQQGGPPVVVGGSTYSLGPSNNVRVNNNQAYILPQITPPPSTKVAGQDVVALPNGISIAGQTLRAGDAPITVGGSTPVFLGSSALVIGSNTIPINQASALALPTINAAGHVLTQAANPAGGFEISGTTLLPGSPAITISGTPYSLAPSGSALVVGSSTIPLATSPSSAADVASGSLTAAGETFTPLNPSQVAISGTTLSIGGSVFTDSNGTPVSLASDGVVIGSSTYGFPTPAFNNVQVTTPVTGGEVTPTTMTTSGQVFTVESDGDVVVAGTTLSEGGPAAAVSGTPISVGTDGVHVGTGGSESVVPLPTGPKAFDPGSGARAVRVERWVVRMVAGLAALMGVML